MGTTKIVVRGNEFESPERKLILKHLLEDLVALGITANGDEPDQDLKELELLAETGLAADEKLSFSLTLDQINDREE